MRFSLLGMGLNSILRRRAMISYSRLRRRIALKMIKQGQLLVQSRMITRSHKILPYAPPHFQVHQLDESVNKMEKASKLRMREV